MDNCLYFTFICKFVSQLNFSILGNLITSRGPGTAIDFALAIVKKFFGEETRSKIAKGLLYE